MQVSTSNLLKTPREFFRQKTISVEIDDKRFLPYSIVFDLISTFNNEILSASIKTVFLTYLPRMSHYGSEIDLWVDLESLGETTILVAKKLAEICVDYLKIHAIKIQLNIKLNAKMTRDNQLFIHYLQELNNQINIEYPSIVKNTSINHVYDARYLKWFGSSILNYETQIRNVLDYAWYCAEIGSEEIGFRILESGYGKATNKYVMHLYLLQLQFMRIASQYYQEATNEQRIIEDQNSELQRLYFLTKAWGSILSRQIAQADEFFKQAGVTIDQIPVDTDSLYRMNIFALLQYLQGNISNAFLIENRIKEVINELNKPRTQLAYINSINLARLHRLAGNYDEAKKNYDSAFSTVKGLKSETDFIYSNVCYGILYEKQSDFYKSLIYWLRASIHWLVTKTPEALGWRAVRAIAQADFKPRRFLNKEIITEALIRKLLFLAEKNNYSNLCSTVNLIQFVLYHPKMNLSQAYAYGIDELSIITQKSKNPIQIDLNESNNTLMNIVSSLLRRLLTIDEETNIFIVDRMNGIDVPTKLESLICSALLLDIAGLRFCKRDINLNQNKRKELLSQLILMPSDSIHEIDLQSEVPFVKHKRYVQKTILSLEEREFLLALQSHNNLSSLHKRFKLSNKKILHLIERKLITVAINREFL